jgi:hypothetical protein
MVGAARFELATSCSRSKRSTRLSYAPIFGIGSDRNEGRRDLKARRVANKIL